MFNEQVTIGNRVMSNTQVALELVQKLKNLELIVEESVAPPQNGAQGYYNINQQLVNQK